MASKIQEVLTYSVTTREIMELLGLDEKKYKITSLDIEYGVIHVTAEVRPEFLRAQAKCADSR